MLATLSAATGRIVETPDGDAFEIEANGTVIVDVSFRMAHNLSWRYDYFRLSMCSAGCGANSRLSSYTAYFESPEVRSVMVQQNLTFEGRDPSEPRFYVEGYWAAWGQLLGGWGVLDGRHEIIIA